MQNFWKKLQRIHDRYQDLKLGVRTHGLREVENLNISDEFKEEANRYEPSPYRLLQQLFEWLPIDDLSQFTFVDYGCGKGRALTVAAMKNFKQVIGVELDPDLAQIARNNLDHTDVQIINQSAHDCDLPIGPRLNYFFNPFSWMILEPTLRNIQLHAIECPQYVILVNPCYKEEVIAMGFREMACLTKPANIFEVVLLKAEPSTRAHTRN